MPRGQPMIASPIALMYARAPSHRRKVARRLRPRGDGRASTMNSSLPLNRHPRTQRSRLDIAARRMKQVEIYHNGHKIARCEQVENDQQEESEGASQADLDPPHRRDRAAMPSASKRGLLRPAQGNKAAGRLTRRDSLGGCSSTRGASGALRPIDACDRCKRFTQHTLSIGRKEVRRGRRLGAALRAQNRRPSACCFSCLLEPSDGGPQASRQGPGAQGPR